MNNNNLSPSGMDPIKWEEKCETELVADIKYIKDALYPVNSAKTEVFSTMKRFGFGEHPLQYQDIESIHQGLSDAETGQPIKLRFMANERNTIVCHVNLLIKRNTVYLFGSYIRDIITPDFVLESILDPGFYILPVEMYKTVLEILTKNYYEHK
jgi:hypothetical protein